jgi:hypothetical protein
MITIKIDEEQAVDLLLKRLQRWTDDEITHELYKIMYTNSADGGVFDCIEFDVMQIVDNDYINYCDVIAPNDDCYNDIKTLYDREGITDISCEEKKHGYNFIEAEYNGYFLVRC